MNAHLTDLAISGGGMVGLSLALAAAREGASVTLIERLPYAEQLEPQFDGRVSAIALSSQHLLSAIGAWDEMAPHAQPINDIRVSDGSSPFFLHYDHREVGTKPFGWIVENRYIRHALVRALAARENVRIVAPAAVTGFAPDSAFAALTLSTGEILRARLAVAADGKNSRLRELANIRALQAEYGQTAIVCTIAHEKPHHGLAQERFLPAGPFAVLPMQDNRSSLVWTEKSQHAPVFLKLAEDEFNQEIRERVGGYLGELRATGPRFSYPLSLSHASEYVAPRLALVGDAAHAIHPIAGQGVNLGFRDVAVLAETLRERRRLGQDIGTPEALAAYQRWRRFDNLTMLAVTDGLTRLFSTTLPPIALARGLGLWGVSKIPPLKRLFMRHAMGLTGELPPLLKEPQS